MREGRSEGSEVERKGREGDTVSRGVREGSEGSEVEMKRSEGGKEGRE